MENNLPSTTFVIPEIPEGVSTAHHPICRDKNPQRHKPHELSDSGEARTDRTELFEKLLVGMFWKREKPVPYAFRTANGEVRSLDAGCLKWLENRSPKEVSFHLDSRGYIEAVTPEQVLLARYERNRDELIAAVSWKKPTVS